ncbi:MAG: DUF2760 domain-containing protein [Planctomycetaceae bacterium]
MGRLSLAWRILTDGSFAQHVQQRLDAAAAAPAAPAAPAKVPAVTPPAAPAAPVTPRPVSTGRSDALSLLAALQREGRLLDFLQEPIDAFSDAQVGAAVRDIHRGCAGVIERQFAVRAVLDQPEGSRVTLSQPPGPEIRLTGKSASAAPTAGILVHPGWQATKCELPVWQGDTGAARILAPAEVE